MESCRYCGGAVNGEYCSDCGQPVKLKKIDWRYVLNEIADVLNVNNRMIYTIKCLLTSPGNSVRQYITEDRNHFVKPISFVFINALIYTLVLYLFPLGIEDIIPQMEVEDMERSISKWILENSGYTTLLIGLFMAFGIKFFFRKAVYNLAETFILLCFVYGITLLFDVVILVLQKITGLNFIQVFPVFEMIYITWAVGQFFDGKKAISYIKALLSYLLGFVILMLVSGIIAIIFFTVIGLINEE